MTRRIQPIARSGRPFSGHKLCGNRSLWFDQALERQRGGAETIVDLSDLEDAAITRLSAPRPTLCGLTMDQPRLMGILNVTPDSFSDGGELDTIEAAVTRARQMAGDTDILDIGGESTRPGAEEVDVQEEIRRTAPVIEAIRAAGVNTPISIDTRKARVAEAALDAGADIVNDVSAFTFDPELADLVAERDVPVCLMHSQGRPEDMQNDPRYDDVLFDVMDYLEERITFAEGKGIKRERIITDPGIGFGKTLEHNVTLLRNLSLLHDLGLPVLLGVSRKRFIGTIGQAEVARDRVAGSVAVAMHGIAQGMQILRVHDTFETRQALLLHAAMTDKK
ncbi:dihydropteroate synthase [Aliiroseovarius halocynthiae]|uniref:Dihydropteroate synthase n=1 Tax=Aliiroseovarius halocynthiae TaxID=985055 RepID=A0A545SRA7_9RHOB|nr:dihydropteroate synthase [Aliiroseovarius halocynthiae]TQV67510.1 dihydropteroate synthase [Aliiroseovarius halocynthiae]SMR81520.1 dihydropteroate synthase [Aliiroseovarius halocynthiae]